MQNAQWDAIWINANLVSCEPGADLQKADVIAVKDGKIVWLGRHQDMSDQPQNLAKEVHDMEGRCLTPGFIDCHTHLVYAGNRAHEFELRLQGATYEDIARQGGGIQSTVSATRAATEAALLQQSLPRARALMASGATTIEIKSGYGLDWETEVKILRVIKKIAEQLPLTVSATFLGAHTIPKEYRERADAYVDLVCHEMIPQVAKEKLADAVDVFCEKIAFSPAQTQRVFAAAKQAGLAVKCHAEQLSDCGATQLAVEYGAWSVDHLEHIGEEGVKALAQSGTVAVLLPGAFYFLRETKLPPIDFLRQNRVPIAIASDCNPGTSPIMSLLIIMNMACTLFRLTPEEALLGVTYHAAKALGLGKTYGSLVVGKAADFAVWNVTQVAELAYYLGNEPLYQLVKGGRVI